MRRAGAGRRCRARRPRRRRADRAPGGASRPSSTSRWLRRRSSATQRLVDLDDLRRDAVAQPLAGQLPGARGSSGRRARSARTASASSPPSRARATRSSSTSRLLHASAVSWMLVRPACGAPTSAGDSRPAALGALAQLGPRGDGRDRRSRVSAASRARASSAAARGLIAALGGERGGGDQRRAARPRCALTCSIAARDRA